MDENITLQTGAAAVAEAPEEVTNLDIATPVLTLEGIDDQAAEAVKKMDERDAEAFRRESFSPEELKQIEEFSEKIDIHDTNVILSYGAGAQKRLSDFSETALEGVRSKDMGEIGKMIADLVVDLKTEPEEERKGIFKFFSKGTDKLEELKAHYAKVETNINGIIAALEAHQQTLLKDIAIQDRLYENNMQYFKELTMYIAAGKMALKKAYDEELPALKAKAAETGLTEDAQAVSDFAALCDRFEKKLYDLDLTRSICLQNAPQIRMVQNNAIIMSDKIQSALVNTIPLWKNQMVISMGLVHAEEAVKAQRMVTETTNDLLKKNSEMLHDTSVNIARENERGIVDIETLQHTSAQLISTLEEIVTIQEEGREKRHAAEAELQRIEDELRAKMVEVGGK